MRADRLVSLVLLLRQRGQLTADVLAKELEVSTRTVVRDIEALDELLATLTDEKQRVIALQPISQKDDATRLCIETCIARNWRLSMQTHKYLNIA